MNMRFASLAVLLALPLGNFASPASAAPTEPLPSAVQERDLDLAACQSWGNGDTKPATLDDVSGSLGLIVPKYPGWVGGTVARGSEEPKAETFQYRIALKQPIALGSLVVPRNMQVRLLKADAPYPGEPTNPAHWIEPAPPMQPGMLLTTLAAETSTRAILFSETRTNGRSNLQGVRLYGPRLHNVTPDAQPYAAEEYTPPNADHPTHPAGYLATGQGSWRNAGKDMSGRVPRAPINDLFPCSLLLAWSEPQTLSGLVLNSNFDKFTAEYYDGPADVHPKAGTAAEWRKLEVAAGGPAIPSESKQSWRYLSFPAVKTRGIRFTTTKTTEGPVAEISAVYSLVDLGSAPVPTRLVRETAPPIAIKLPLAEPMNVTVGVNGPDGRRIKNLVVREPRSSGEQTIGWDLKDGDGNFVAPGKYPWTAITYPDLQTKYAMTVYPNVTRYAPDNSPWLNAMNGSGGWMADHSPPVSGCAAGDRVYLGSYVAESGVSLIECDLKGQKLWGHHSFAAWTGPQFLASDGKEVFVGANILNTSNESVWAVDMATKEVRRPLSLVPTSTRPRGMRGLAVHDGKIYIACQGVESYVAAAASADDVDVLKCVPTYPVARPPRVQYEIVPDRRNDFLRLFRLQGTPPGGATQYTLEQLRPMGIQPDEQHVVVAFHKPVAIGSLAFPVPAMKNARVVVSVLKSNASYPPDAERNDQWLRLPEQATQSWDVIALPPNTETRALRISFVRGAAGDNDPLAGLLEKPKPKNDGFDALDKPKGVQGSKKDLLSFGGASEGDPEYGLEGMKLLRRRLTNVAGAAKISVSSGKVGTDGVWDAERTMPLTEEDPATYLMQWPDAQSLRGLAIKEIDGELTKIDVLKEGAGSIDIRGNDGWETIAEYRQERRDHHTGFASANPTARYYDGYVDFGREVATRAVRLRVVKQWTDNLPDARGIRADLGGTKLDATRCHIYGVAALKYLGGEPAIDAAAFQRIEIYDVKTGAPLGETPIAQPGQIAVDAKGELLAISGTSIVRVDFKQGKHAKLIDGLELPTALAVDRQGNIYVHDNGSTRKQMRVYDPSGTLLRSIGKPGGFVAGPWDQQRLGDVTALAVDAQNQLWVVENQYHPKRITVWSTAGEFLREHLGNTSYGGGGVLDRKDKNRLFYGPMEFELDWKTGLSRIKNLHWLGKTPPGEVLHEIAGREYLATRAGFAEQQVGVVYRYENGKARLAAAMGQGDMFEPLKETKLLNALGNKALAQCSFLWSDVSGDGEVQADEVKLVDHGRRPQALTLFNRDLSIQAGPTRYTVKEFLPSGVPIYEITTNPKLEGIVFRLDDGGYHKIGNRIHEEGLTADGTQRWTYPIEGAGVQQIGQMKPWQRSQVTSQFGIVGHETTGMQGPGDFVVLHTNTGGWNIWTHDGLLIGPLFRDLRDPRAKPWSMKQHDREMWLTDITVGQEHFRGHFSRNEQDGKYYAIAGHNHISVVEVAGLERTQRIDGTLDITAADIERARQWDMRREQTAVYARAAVVDAYRLRKAPAIDGRLTGWGPPDAEITGLDEDYRSRTGAEFRIGFDADKLYLAWRVRGLGPLKNTGEQWERLFKTGASVDLQLATNQEATVDRQAPEVGDLRLLLTFVGEKPAAILYRPIVPGTKPENVVRITSPTGEVRFDEIKRLDDVRLVRNGDDQQYTIEAAIPLRTLGIAPKPGLRLKMDWGVLVTGPDGNEVMRRIYWSNKATSIVADAPSEARLAPHLWGHVRFQDLRPSAEETLGPATDEKKPKSNNVDDLLNDLKPAKK